MFIDLHVFIEEVSPCDLFVSATAGIKQPGPNFPLCGCFYNKEVRPFHSPIAQP